MSNSGYYYNNNFGGISIMATSNEPLLEDSANYEVKNKIALFEAALSSGKEVKLTRELIETPAIRDWTINKIRSVLQPVDLYLDTATCQDVKLIQELCQTNTVKGLYLDLPNDKSMIDWARKTIAILRKIGPIMEETNLYIKKSFILNYKDPSQFYTPAYDYDYVVVPE
jgi:hypothetical protein